ncbi:MAG: DUF4407 domain-containing protein [Candidatus Competibacteraceae bacterium]
MPLQDLLGKVAHQVCYDKLTKNEEAGRKFECGGDATSGRRSCGSKCKSFMKTRDDMQTPKNQLETNLGEIKKQLEDIGPQLSKIATEKYRTPTDQFGQAQEKAKRGLLANIMAFEELKKTQNPIDSTQEPIKTPAWYADWFFFILFFILDMTGVIIVFFSRRGLYDKGVDIINEIGRERLNYEKEKEMDIVKHYHKLSGENEKLVMETYFNEINGLITFGASFLS